MSCILVQLHTATCPLALIPHCTFFGRRDGRACSCCLQMTRDTLRHCAAVGDDVDLHINEASLVEYGERGRNEEGGTNHVEALCGAGVSLGA